MMAAGGVAAGSTFEGLGAKGVSALGGLAAKGTAASLLLTIRILSSDPDFEGAAAPVVIPSQSVLAQQAQTFLTATVTSPNAATFFSGLSPEQAYEEATTIGGTTIANVLEASGVNPGAVVNWPAASLAYAQQASGVVTAFVSNEAPEDGIWRTIELPALLRNPNVTQIIITNITTGATTIMNGGASMNGGIPAP
jgi:hypothetical protein